MISVRRVLNLDRILARYERNPASELAKLGHTKRRASVKETARRIREELGLPEDRRLA